MLNLRDWCVSVVCVGLECRAKIGVRHLKFNVRVVKNEENDEIF